MRYHKQLTKLLTIATLLATPLTFTACGGLQVYDPYYRDYHGWNRTEDGFYRQWEGATGRGHMAFERRPVADQHAYFDWRHKG